MSAVVLPAAISHFTSTQVIFSNSTRSVFAHGAAHTGAAVSISEAVPPAINISKDFETEPVRMSLSVVRDNINSPKDDFASHFSAQNPSDLIPVHSGLVLTRAVTDYFFGHCFKRGCLIADVPGISCHVLISNLEIHIGLIR